MQRVGILGSAVVGQTLAQGFKQHGYEVRIGSRTPAKLASFTESSGIPADTFDAVGKWGELLVLSVHGTAAEAALTLLAATEAPIHLMVCDIVLPGMDGTELATRVVHDRPDMRLLFMSGYGDRLGTVEGFLQPKVQLLEKPFSAHALLTKTREVLEAPCESVTT